MVTCKLQQIQILRKWQSSKRFKGTLHAIMTISDPQRYPFNLYLINYVEDFVVFLDLKQLNSIPVFVLQ